MGLKMSECNFICLDKRITQKEILDRISKDLFYKTLELVQDNPKTDLTQDYCFNGGCIWYRDGMYNPRKNNYLLKNNDMILN